MLQRFVLSGGISCRVFSPFRGHWRDRLRAAGWHLLCSAVLIGGLAGLALGVWYPPPFQTLSGGLHLLGLLALCDVILGPMMTFIVFNRAKPRSALRRDMAVVLLIQAAALAYGLWSVYVARPVAMVFERDLFRVIHAVDIPPDKASDVNMHFLPKPWQGPVTLSLRDFKDDRERMAVTGMEIEGLFLSAMPEFWQAHALAREAVRQKGFVLSTWAERVPVLREAARHCLGRDPVRNQAPGNAAETRSDLLVLPLVDRQQYWTVLLDQTTLEPLCFLPVDAYEVMSGIEADAH